MTLSVGEAKTVAREWVLGQTKANLAITGAFFHGSITSLPDDASLSATSDVDVMVVRQQATVGARPGKFLYDGVLLEVSFLTEVEVRSPEEILGQYQLAGSFRSPGLIFDPSGHLAAVQAVVGREFSRWEWVRRRCEHARSRVLDGFPLRDDEPWPSQNNAWLFPAGVMTHVLLVAGLRNPTVRRRYQTTRELLADYGELDIYGRLLDLLGATDLSPERVTHHLVTMTDAFDAAQRVIRSPFFFAADISDAGRSVAIDGSAEMIAEGAHREAMFWIAATWSRCLQVLEKDGGDTDLIPFEQAYGVLLADLGIVTVEDVRERRKAIEAALPEIWLVAERIMAANTEIEG